EAGTAAKAQAGEPDQADDAAAPAGAPRERQEPQERPAAGADQPEHFEWGKDPAAAKTPRWGDDRPEGAEKGTGWSTGGSEAASPWGDGPGDETSPSWGAPRGDETAPSWGVPPGD